MIGRLNEKKGENMAAKENERRVVDQRGYKKKRVEKLTVCVYANIGALIGDDKQSNYTKRAGSRRCGER